MEKPEALAVVCLGAKASKAGRRGAGQRSRDWNIIESVTFQSHRAEVPCAVAAVIYQQETTFCPK
jgi:hypothetical protein